VRKSIRLEGDPNQTSENEQSPIMITVECSGRMAYGSESHGPLFEKLCAEVPNLGKLEHDIVRSTQFLMMEDPRPTTQDDTEMIWDLLFKPRLQRLLGRGAEGTSAIAARTDAYNTATRYLYRALAPSEETLGESSRLRAHQLQYKKDRKDWDGSGELDFVSSEKVMQILVERVGLPVTEEYLIETCLNRKSN
jgi:hypothetical protein